MAELAELDGLTMAIGRPHHGYGCGRRAMSQQDLAGLLKERSPPLALRVVESDDDVRGGQGVQAALDGLARREQIAQTEHRKIVRQRRADQRRRGLGGRHTRNDLGPGGIAWAPPLTFQVLKYQP